MDKKVFHSCFKKKYQLKLQPPGLEAEFRSWPRLDSFSPLPPPRTPRVSPRERAAGPGALLKPSCGLQLQRCALGGPGKRVWH